MEHARQYRCSNRLANSSPRAVSFEFSLGLAYITAQELVYERLYRGNNLLWISTYNQVNDANNSIAILAPLIVAIVHLFW